MAPLIIRAPEIRLEADKLTLVARVETPDESYDMWFRGSRDVLRPWGADAFVITCMPTAMKLGLPMVVEGPVSPRLLASLEIIQDILCKWYTEFNRIRIEANLESRPRPAPTNATAAFFSGGVDSFYTALKNRDAISSLILVHGFDLALENAYLRARVADAMKQAAAKLDKPLVEIETNSKPFADRYVLWDMHQYGPALAALAVLLGGVADRVLIPSSESYARMDPCASHPLLDPLWSTEYMTLIHDGAEASRNEKVSAISRFPPALSLLRVCWENPDNAYNCGRCEKCIRTMLNLEGAGTLADCTAFETPLDLERVANLRFPSQLVVYLFEENLQALKVRNADAALIQALGQALTRFEAEKLAKALLALPNLPANTLGLAAAAGRHTPALLRAIVRHGQEHAINLLRYYKKRVFG